MLCVTLIEVVGDADIPAVVFAFEYVDEGADYDGFKHFNKKSVYKNNGFTAAPHSCRKTLRGTTSSK